VLHAELNVLRTLCTNGHPNMVALIAEGAASPPTNGGNEAHHLLLEHCPASLVDVLRDFPDGLPRPQLMALLHDCVEGLVLMHSQQPPIAHRYAGRKWEPWGQTLRDFGATAPGLRVMGGTWCSRERFGAGRGLCD
jgi:hypothetical protein